MNSNITNEITATDAWKLAKEFRKANAKKELCMTYAKIKQACENGLTSIKLDKELSEAAIELLIEKGYCVSSKKDISWYNRSGNFYYTDGANTYTIVQDSTTTVSDIINRV